MKKIANWCLYKLAWLVVRKWKLFYKYPPKGDDVYFMWMGIYQRIFWLSWNHSVPWAVHPTSRVQNWEGIRAPKDANFAVSPGCNIEASNGLTLGENVLIAPRVSIISSNHNQEDFSKFTKDKGIIIGKHVWIGTGAIILPGVQIGSNSVIGAGSVVVKDIPANCVAVGNPCRPVKYKMTNEIK